MERLILREVRQIGVGWLESQYGSLEEYIERIWDVPITRAVRLAVFVYDNVGMTEER